MPIYLTESLSVSGNANHLGGFLQDYEDAIDLNGEIDKPLTKAPHYFAWINTASEQVFYRIRELIYINSEDHSVFDAPYKSLLDYVIENGRLSEAQIEVILLFAKIRHLLVHKGFPNPHLAPSEKSREIAKGKPFTACEVSSLAERLQSPACYVQLRDQHRAAMQAIESCETEFTHDFGFLRISKKR
jgi:hypothetical protein